VVELDAIDKGVTDSAELLELVEAEDDASGFAELERDAAAIEKRVATLEFTRMFPGEMDSNNAFLDIQAGAGGTEAQDWADMLMRMYLRWAEARGFKADLVDESRGEVAGIKGATIKIDGSYAYGWLRTETGVHRLVRKSPFDSGNRRHTSFASVFV
jgi:peptide chain release factor 2